MSKAAEQTFLQRRMDMVNKHRKRRSMSLDNREMQIETT